MTTGIIIIFILGYLLIATEHLININKAAIALVTGILCWVLYAYATPDKEMLAEELVFHLGDMSGILFFLMGAMAIVGLIDTNNGFDIITARITQTDKRKLLLIISLIAFFLSPLLDNLTTTIVMVLLIRKLIKKDNDRLIFVCMVVLSSNAGGVWSPIGDITSTMLWIGGQITVPQMTFRLFLPSLACMVIPLVILSRGLQGLVERPAEPINSGKRKISVRNQYIVLLSGLLILICVPVFKITTHLPPYMGILLGLGILWVITEILRSGIDADGRTLSVAYALQKIDTPSILFFFGILMAVAAMQAGGILTAAALWLNGTFANEAVLVSVMGLLSSVVDNVPLVAAMQKMYSMDQYPANHFFWEFLAYCTGTGGSLLIIGSAAGIAATGMEKVKFFWYLKNISLPALLGFSGGMVVYLLQNMFL